MPRHGVKIPTNHHPTLCEAFRELQHTDASCILKLRKLQALPENEAEELLTRHFGSIAGLATLHLICPPSKATKRSGAQQCRLSGLGFLVLRTAADVDKVLGRGYQQRVADATVTLERFERAHAP